MRAAKGAAGNATKSAARGAAGGLRALVHASELLTGAGVRARDGRRVCEEDLGRIADGALVYSTRKVNGLEIPDRIQWVGETSKLPSKYARAPKKDLRGQRALIPGLVDCHTHLVFAGDRSDEFAARCEGATYQEIAARGGGIVATVEATRRASIAELERLAIARVQEMSSYGVRVIETKSGYGLSHEAEIKLLQVVERLRRRFPEIAFHSTYLGAHAWPHGVDRKKYFEEMLSRTLPEVARRGLAESCDVFVDEGYFSVDEGREILTRAKELGLSVRVHADELGDTGSAALAASLGALSADHLLKISTSGVRVLGSARDTVAVVLPGTAFYLKAPHAPARALIEAGACVALATDFNPGTSMCLSLPAVMTISALYLGLTRAELFAAVTYNGAKALGLHERLGTLEVGMEARFASLPFARFEEMYYRFAWSPKR